MTTSIFERNRCYAESGVWEGGSGGALLLYSSTSQAVGVPLWAVSDCTFVENGALQVAGQTSGGAVYALNGALQVFRSSFVKNEAVFGGAVAVILALNDAPFELLDARFVENEAEISGGAVYVSSTLSRAYQFFEWEVSKCLFENNKAHAGDGGGLFGFGKPDAAFRSNVFTFNRAENGAGMFLEDIRRATATDNLFEDNTAALDGGGLILSEDLEGGDWSGTHFKRNTALEGGGGGLLIQSASGDTFAFRNFTFQDCSAPDGKGGGLEINNMDLHGEFTDGVVSDCYAHNGGGMSFTDTTPFLKKITYSGCRAHEGGTLSFLSAIHEIDASKSGLTNLTNYLTIAEDLDIADSAAETEESSFKVSKGGAVLMILVEAVRMNRVRITGADANKGGAVAVQSSLVVVDEWAVTDGHSENGGAFHLAEAWMIFVNSTITHSTATKEGGGVYAFDSIFVVLGLEVFECASEYGGGMFMIESTGSLQGVHFDHNYAGHGGAAYAHACTMEVKGVVFENNGGTGHFFLE